MDTPRPSSPSAVSVVAELVLGNQTLSAAYFGPQRELSIALVFCCPLCPLTAWVQDRSHSC